MASRSVWSGTIVLGEVAVPVSLYVAQKRDELAHKTLHRGCYSAVKQKKVCAHDGHELAAADIVKGYEFSPGQYVLVDDTPAAAAAKEIRLEAFTPAASVPALHLDTSYSVAAAEDDASRHAYAVLTRALERTGMAGLGRLTMYGKEHVTLLQPIDGTLYLTTLYLGRDLRRPIADTGDVAENEVKLAARLIRAHAGRFAPEAIASDAGVKAHKLINDKVAAGDTVAAPDAAIAPVDLADALRKSVKPKPARRAAPRATRP